MFICFVFYQRERTGLPIRYFLYNSKSSTPLCFELPETELRNDVYFEFLNLMLSTLLNIHQR